MAEQPEYLGVSSNEVIDRLKATHPAFALPPRPLAIGIRYSLATAHPEIHPHALRIALARWCGRPDYLKALMAGGPRFALDGTPCGEMTETHRASAVLRLDSLKTRLTQQGRKPARPRPLKKAIKAKVPIIKTRPQRSTAPPSPTETYTTTGGRALLTVSPPIVKPGVSTSTGTRPRLSLKSRSRS